MHRIRPRLPVFLRHRQRFRRLPKRLLLLGRRRSDPGVLSLHSGILHIYHLQRVVQRGLHPVPGRKPMPDDQLAHRVRLHVLLRRGLHLPDAVRAWFLLSKRHGPAQLLHRRILLRCRFDCPATLRSWLFLSKRQRADPVLDAKLLRCRFDGAGALPSGLLLQRSERGDPVPCWFVLSSCFHVLGHLRPWLLLRQYLHANALQRPQLLRCWIHSADPVRARRRSVPIVRPLRYRLRVPPQASVQPGPPRLSPVLRALSAAPRPCRRPAHPTTSASSTLRRPAPCAPLATTRALCSGPR